MDPSRRAFLGRAAGASGIALTTPWWGPWLRKFFGPSGHIHDMKVRTYQSQPSKKWAVVNWEVDEAMLGSLESEIKDGKWVPDPAGMTSLPFMNRVASDDDPWGAMSIDFGPVASINVARPDQKQLELKVVNRPGIYHL